MTLNLFLKAKWYDLIVNGSKREEYRIIKPYWSKRLFAHHYTHVVFHNGYSATIATFELVSIFVGFGNQEWGAPNQKVYIIKFK